MRHRTGLRNRRRTGRSTYSRKFKSKRADYYGEYVNGKQVTDEKLTVWVAPR